MIAIRVSKVCFYRNLLMAVLLASLPGFLLTGCNEKDDPSQYQSRIVFADEGGNGTTTANSNNTNTIPRIKGNWSGSYYRTDRPERLSLTAKIEQDRDAVIITTSKSGGTAVNFTGNIRNSGNMRLTDAYDGEAWTTYYGPAKENRIVIADYVYSPSSNVSNRPLYVVELSR